MLRESLTDTSESPAQEFGRMETPGDSKSVRPVRIVFELNEDDVEAFDNISQAIGLKRRTEVLRYAIGLLETCAPYLKDGYEIKLQKEESVVKIVVPRLSRRSPK